MGSSLEFVVVMPAGGGKTTISQKHEQTFLDIDALYNLRESQSTYDRMNAELERRAAVRQSVPPSVAADLRSRITNYTGSARCLLLHSLTLAEACGLQLLLVLIPSPTLHTSLIAPRHATGKWFARQNVEWLLRSCQQKSLNSYQYSNCMELEQIIEGLLPILPEQKQKLPHCDTNIPITTCDQQEKDEALLLAMCTLAIGCNFEKTEARVHGCGGDLATKADKLRPFVPEPIV